MENQSLKNNKDGKDREEIVEKMAKEIGLFNDKLFNFLGSFGAIEKLLNRAQNNKCLIETLVLYATSVDALCRFAVVLTNNLQKKETPESILDYVHQDNNTRNYLTERTIYKLARDNGVLNKELFQEINRLYDVRNRVVHRFFLSNISYTDLDLGLRRYRAVCQKLWEILDDLFEKDLQRMKFDTTAHPQKFSEMIHDPILQEIINKKIRSREEATIGEMYGCETVEGVVNFAREAGFLKKCANCDHWKIYHLNSVEFEHAVKNKSKSKDKNINIEDYIGGCNKKSCQCKHFKN